MAPAFLAILVSGFGVYKYTLAPDLRSSTITDVAQVLAFLVIALLIAGLVSQRNRAVALLIDSEAHHRSVTESAADVVVTIDSDSRILAINPAVEGMFGYTPAELIGQEMMTLMPEEYRAAHKAGIARYLATQVRHIPWNGVQLPGRRKDGALIPLEISFSSHMAGAEQRFSGFIRNISDRRQAEAALLQSERLAAVGRLASSIAHEINNPLEAVTNLLYLCQRSTDPEEIQTYLEMAEREVRRVSVIANQTLQFHGRSTTPAPAQCEELIAGSLALYQGRLINSQIRVEQRYRAVGMPLCIEGEIRQVLNNLIGNAIDALPREAGRLLVRSRDATSNKGERGVVLTIADTGAGMSPATRQRIFEPFFSTKGNGGTGLGLWICSQLTEQNGGALRVRSSQRTGRTGTVFTLFLPAASRE